MVLRLGAMLGQLLMRLTDRLEKHADDARGVMLKIVDGKTTGERVDGYVLLKPDEAVRLAKLLRSGRRLVHDAYFGGGDHAEMLMDDFRTDLDALEPE